MIKSKSDLSRALEECRIAYGIPAKRSLKRILADFALPNRNYSFMRNLCRFEYHFNLRSGRWGISRLYHRLMSLICAKRHSRLFAQTGIELTVNCAEPGLHVSHGRITVSGSARIGKHCKILSDVTIGGRGIYDGGGAPTLGERVFVGTGAKILGNIKIADGVVIGANAVVVKDILEPDTTWGGVPARKLNGNGSDMYLRKEFRKNANAERKA